MKNDDLMKYNNGLTQVFWTNFEQIVVVRRHTMDTLSVSLALCEGNPPVTGGFPSQRAGNAGFDVFCDVTDLK